MNCIVVDDEPIALEGIASYVDKTPFLNLIGKAKNAFEALELLENQSVDLMFLDINMPRLSGIDLIKTLEKPPMVILATANPNHALEGFELNVVDYLLKPIGYTKFLKSSKKAHDLYNLKQKNTDSQTEYFFVKVNKELVKIQLKEILYVEGLKDYILIKTNQKEYIVYLTMSKVLENLPSSAFVQVHKSFIVQIEKVQKIIGNQVIVADKTIPIGRTYKPQALKQITKNNIIRK